MQMSEQEEFRVYRITRTNQYGGIRHIYEVSNKGNVKIDGKLYVFSDKISPKSYYVIGPVCVHRAVAELFIPNPENKPCVDHINTDRHDNRVENLRWVTYAENNQNILTRQHISEHFQTEEGHNNLVEASRRYWADEENHKKASIKFKEIWQREGYRESMIEKRKEVYNTPEAKEMFSIRQTKYWANEENRINQGNKIRNRKCINNGEIEKRVFEEELEQYLANGWKLGRITFKWSEEAKERRSKTFVPWNKGKHKKAS